MPHYHNVMKQIWKKKTRNYNNIILQTEHGTFTPLVFSIYRSMGIGSMGRDCTKFCLKLAELLSDKRKQSQFDSKLIKN